MLALGQKSQSQSIGSLPNRRRLAWAAAFLLSLGGAGICEAENTLVVTAQSLPSALYPTGTKLYTPEVSPIQESSACSEERTDVKAPQYLIIPTPIVDAATGKNTSTLVYYEFVFWNINGDAYSTERVAFYPNCGVQNAATAWYRVICDPNPAGCNDCGGGGMTATVFAFSLTSDKPIVDITPIESVTGGTWTGAPSTTLTLPAAPGTATVDLLSALGEYGSFVEWQLDGGALEKSHELTLTAPGEFAIAFYQTHEKPITPPCPPGPHTCT